MAEATTQDEGPPPGTIQKILDNPWLLLVLGIVIPTLSYTVWGWWSGFCSSRQNFLSAALNPDM